MKPNAIPNPVQRPRLWPRRVAALVEVLVAVMFSGMATSNLRAADLGTSNLLQQARALCQQSFRNLTISNRQENFASFRRLLPALAAADAEVRGSTPEDKTLLRVAREAGSHPTLIDELLEFYGKPAKEFTDTRVQLPPRPQAAHLTEAYRPAWEALLLAPPSHEIVFMQQGFTITAALFWIGNPESLPVLELAFAATCEEGVNAVEGSGAVGSQFRIMECLNRFATRGSLQAMFRCLSRAETASDGHLPEYSGHNLREWVVRFLTDQDNYKTGEKWRQVLKSFPKDDLPASQRELLERATRQQ